MTFTTGVFARGSRFYASRDCVNFRLRILRLFFGANEGYRSLTYGSTDRRADHYTTHAIKHFALTTQDQEYPPTIALPLHFGCDSKALLAGVPGFELPLPYYCINKGGN